MAKKPGTVKKVVKKGVIPPEILTKLKRVKTKFFKDDTVKAVKEIYLELYREDKEKYKDKKWSNMIFHKRALTKLKNQKKSEKLGGAVDKYYGVILGDSKVRDLSDNRRSKIIREYEDDPEKSINEELIMVRKATNPTTGEVEKVPLLDESGGIIPRDNVEFFKRKSGSKFKNANFGKAISHAYRKSAIGVCSNTQGIKGVFVHELRDKSTELEIPINVLVKFSGKTIGTEIIAMDENKYIDKDLLKEMITNLDDDIEQGIIAEEYASKMKEHYTKLLSITKKKKKKKGEDEEDDENEKYDALELADSGIKPKTGKEIEITLFKLRSTKGTAFIKVENEKEFESVDFPMKNHMEIDINLLYKEYFYPFTSDCFSLLNYHKDHRYIDGDEEKIDYDEFVCLQDVNLIQINMEASMGGNYTLYIEDETLFNKDVSHLDEEIDAIKLLVPSYINLNFAQDSKLNIIGSPVQFQAQDDEREDLWETEIATDKNGNTITDEDGTIKQIKVPVMGYPLIMVNGIFPIPEYIKEVETVDLTFEDDADIKKIVLDEETEEEESSDELEKIKDAIEDVEELEEEIKPKPPKKKPTPKKPKEPEKKPDEIDDEDEADDANIW
ncbi:hypothetical protein LCGC14_2005360 [marine sediment metagenome]|uniref:Uncharacterized protein n=1 Tax=marine sediment metagenome TaxID=412755 RepID=A0A0F9F215_9ZZZZ